MPEEWHDWNDFLGEWVRALFNGGKATGLPGYEKR